MKWLSKNYPNIISIIKIYLTGLVLFFIFRFTLFLNEISRLSDIPVKEKLPNILGGFWMGMRFDTVISGYILLLPFVLITVGLFFKSLTKLFSQLVFWIIFIAYTLAFILCAIDIPYFKQFFSRLTVVALEWMSTPGFVFKMIIQEHSYLLYLIPLIAICVTFYFITRKILRNLRDKEILFTSWKNLALKIFISLIFGGFIFLGIRGRITIKSPIRVGTAYFSKYAFINLMGLNPVFTFLRSALDEGDEKNKSIQLMDPDLAIKMVQYNFNILSDSGKTPIARTKNKLNQNSSAKNIIIVLMESMSCRKLSILGNTDYHTPSLDSMANKGYFFTNFYSAGIHTFNGIYSTIISYPALLKQHPMSAVDIKHYNGIATVLKKYQYYNMYFTTHDGQFDNVEGFLTANDFDRIISQKDYPANEIKSTLGVPDDYMFRFSIPILTEIYKKHGKFLTVMCTASDHPPFVIPEYFTPQKGDIKHQIVEYADWSIGQFVSLASKEEWFENTVFVFLADHGAPIDAVYSMALTYNHIPLIIYSPSFLPASRYEQPGGQIDVFPTLMGILNLPYTNNTLGIDLLHEKRPYMYFSADDKIGVVDQDYLYIWKTDNSQGLYKYRNRDLTDYSASDTMQVRKMKDYAFSNLQTAQWMIDNNKTSTK